MNTIQSLSLPLPINIEQCLSPFDEYNQPILINIPNTNNLWVAIYTTKEKLEKSTQELGITNYKIKMIADGLEFVQSLAEHKIRIMLDPFITENNNTRWTEIKQQ